MGNKIFAYDDLSACPLCGSEAHKTIELVEGFGDFSDYHLAVVKCENPDCELQMQDANTPFSHNIEKRWNNKGDGSLRYENELLSANFQDAINKLTNRSFIVWRNPENELPREVDTEVLVYSGGEVLSATYDYYCPVISSERVSKWVIYRTPGSITYLPGKVDLWAYAPMVGDAKNYAQSADKLAAGLMKQIEYSKELEEKNKKLHLEQHRLQFVESEYHRLVWWIQDVYARQVKDAILKIKSTCTEERKGTCAYELPARIWEELGKIMELSHGIYDGTYMDNEISTNVKTSNQKKLGDEVMEIIAAALSGDCQKYINYDLHGNKYCKWGIVEKDIRAIFETSPDNNKCHWIQEDDEEICLWRTDCGEAFYFTEGTPTDNKLKFCCYCGKELIEEK